MAIKAYIPPTQVDYSVPTGITFGIHFVDITNGIFTPSGVFLTYGTDIPSNFSIAQLTTALQSAIIANALTFEMIITAEDIDWQYPNMFNPTEAAALRALIS